MTWHRILSGVIFFTLLLLGLFQPAFGWFPPIIILVGVIWGVWEFNHLGVKRPPTAQLAISLSGAAALLADSYFFSQDHSIIIIGMTVVLAIAAGLTMREGDVAAVSGKSVVAMIYVGLPLALIIRLWKDNLNPGAEYPNAGAHYILFLIIVTWASDVGAYFAGRWFGRIKIVPRLSPGKTLEGYIGGFLLTIAVAVGVKVFWNNIDALFGWWDILALALGFSILAPAGDLAESQLKRSAKVKDSGLTFTGHGGMLDIIDSLLFTTTFYVAYLALFHPEVFQPKGPF
jgi:phosphatidate cytidylyltransferase